MPSRKFSGLRAELERARQTGSAPDGKSRAPGKRSDPAWTQHTVMLKKATHRAAAQILLHQDGGMDMSDLIERLLAAWVSQHRTKM